MTRNVRGATITVVLPVHNGGEFLRTCMDSLLCQTLENFQVVVGDDGSTDGTPDILRGYARDPRIRFYRWPSPLGLFANLNRLLQEVTTPLVRFLCQDDWLREDCLQREVDFFNEHGGLGMSFCKATLVDRSGRVLQRGALGDLPTTMEPLLSLQHLFYHGCIPGSLSTVCVKTGCFRNAGMFDTSFRVAGDYEGWTRLLRENELGVIHDHLVFLRTHADQLSRARDSGPQFVEECRRVRQSLLAILPSLSWKSARLFGYLRHNVLDTHYCVTRLLRGDLRNAALVARSLGWRDLVLGLIAWALTVDNRLWRPAPRFMMPSSPEPCGLSALSTSRVREERGESAVR